VSFVFGEYKENPRKTNTPQQTKDSKPKNPKTFKQNKNNTNENKNSKTKSLREIGTADIEESLVARRLLGFVVVC